MARRIGIGIGIGVGVASFAVGMAWMWFQGRSGESSDRTADRSQEEVEAVANANLDRWTTAPKLVIVDLSESDLTGIFEVALTDSGSTPIPPESIASLAERLTRETRVRSIEDADAYVAWAESRKGERWITPLDSREWSRESTVMRDLFQEELTAEGFQASIRRLIGQARMSEDGAIFRGIGDPSRCTSGCFRTRAYRVRSAEQYFLYASESFDTPQEADEWLMSPAASISRLRVPERSIDDICRESGSALVVEVAAVMELAEDRSGIWETTWYWDARSASWQLENMSWRSSYVVGMWY